MHAKWLAALKDICEGLLVVSAYACFHRCVPTCIQCEAHWHIMYAQCANDCCVISLLHWCPYNGHALSIILSYRAAHYQIFSLKKYDKTIKKARKNKEVVDNSNNQAWFIVISRNSKSCCWCFCRVKLKIPRAFQTMATGTGRQASTGESEYIYR